MTPNPILKVLSTLTTRRVRHLLMGGQACVFYGAAEFSRDTDVALLAESENLDRLTLALADLDAHGIAVPPASLHYLLRGHALHFRCAHPEARNMRLDVMSVMRGVDPFEDLWARRTTLEVEPGVTLEMLSLPDLVAAKKTQRDKDWPMIRRLLEAHHATHRDDPSPEQIDFWLAELRTPALLLTITSRYPEMARSVSHQRPLLGSALAGDEPGLATALAEEERRERDADRAYWLPLRKELEALRHEGASS